MRFHHKDHRGFTLLEMLLVLSVSSAIILLPVLQVKTWQDRLIVAYFFKNVEQKLMSMQQLAIVGQTTVLINAEESEQRIVCQYQKNSREVVVEELFVPEQVLINKTTTVKFLSKTGNISKIERFEFLDQLHKVRHTYQYQIGSGRFVKKTTSL